MTLHPLPEPDRSAPSCPLPSAPGWAYSLGDDGWERGVYRSNQKGTTWNHVAPLPHVTHRLTDRDGDGKRLSIRYRLTSPDTPEGPAAVVSRKELAEGVWAGKLDMPLPTGKTVVEAVAAAIIDVAYRTTEAEEAVPEWVEGELRLPPADTGLIGYTERASDEDRAREAWREIATIARKSPKMVLLMGAAFAGVYSKALRRQIHLWELVGDARQGKSTTTMLCAATLGWSGDPEVLDGILRPLSSTPQGLLQEMRGLGVLPAVYDESGGIATRTNKQREELLFTIFSGGRKGMGVRPGETSYRSAGYHSTVITSGNSSLVSGIDTEGIVSKTLTVRTPITMPSPGLVGEEAEADASADADRLRELVPLAYGWPLAWLMERGMDVDRVRSILARSEAALPLPAGGVAQTIGRHISLAVTGCVLLSELIGQELTDVAIAYGRELLAERMAEMEEEGLTPADRLLRAITEAMAARPRCFPEIDVYKAHVTGTFIGGEVPQLPSIIDGFIPSDDQVAILPGRIGAIAEAAGISDHKPGLTALRDRGQLRVKSKKRMTVSFRIRPKPARVTDVYLLQLPQEEEPQEGQQPDQPQVSEAAKSAGTVTADLAPAILRAVPALPEEAPQEQRQEEPEQQLLQEEPEAGEAELALGATVDGMTTHDGRTVTVGGAYASMAAFLERVLELMPAGGTVAIDGAVAKLLGMGSKPWLAPDPKSRSKKKSTPPECVASAADQGWKHGVKGVLGSTTWVRPGVRESVTIVVPEWTSATIDLLEVGGRQLLADDTDVQSAAYRLGRFRELTGTHWVNTGGTSLMNLSVAEMFSASHPVRIELTTGCPLTLEPQEGPLGWQAAGDGGSLLALPEWAKALGFIHAFDARAAYLAAMGRADLSRSSLRHTGPGTPIDPQTPGYWLIPERDYRLPCGVPILTSSGDRRHVWVATPTAGFLIEMGLLDYGDAVDSWSVPDHTVTNRKTGKKRKVRDGARLMKSTAERIRDGLLDIPEGTEDPDEAAVRKVIKSGYSELVGQFKTDSGAVRRSDWRDTIVAVANVTILRRVHQAWEATGGEQGGITPVRLNTDAAYYVTDTEDAEEFRPEAFPVDPEWRDKTGRFTLGKFKVDCSGPVADYLEGKL